jgi:hypothetical protein|tara:strand:+ start:362 stop:1318 length:957 start_codon:yes stop_codon:yes gene_type:complete
MYRFKKLSLSALIVITASMLFGQEETGGGKLGSVGLKFLNINVDARDAALGGSASLASGASSVFVNPAGLASATGISVSAGTFSWLVESNVTHASFALPLMGGAVGLFYYALDYGDLNLTTWSSVSDGGVTFDANSSTFAANDAVMGAAYGRQLSDKFSIGAAAKMVSENIDDYSITALAYDVGFQFTTGYKNINLGASISNFGSDVQDADEAYDEFALPMNFDFGVTGQVFGDDAMGLVGGLNMAKFSDLGTEITLGGEFTVMGLAKLRGSYNLAENHTSPLGLGAGINFAGLSLDLCMTSFSDFDSVMRISIGYSL